MFHSSLMADFRITWGLPSTSMTSASTPYTVRMFSSFVSFFS